MERINKLLTISKYLGVSHIEEDLFRMKTRLEQKNAEIILPLVGEFSSGKTTLINSLTDSKKLETATKPTTATIYEVYFGREKNYAHIVADDNSVLEVSELENLKNAELSESKCVRIFDKSKVVPSTTILVDTPGLSSPDPKHKQTLIGYLPYADGVLLVIDVNQQITRSISDFIDTMRLSKRPIYLVITKCDTKSSQDIKAVKQYISQNCSLPIEKMICVSAQKNNLEELHGLFDKIQNDKNKILQNILDYKVATASEALRSHINELLKASSSDTELEQTIRIQERELMHINNNIERLINDTVTEIEDSERVVTRRFEDIIFEKLDCLVAGKSNNFDGEAVSIINSASSILLNEYRENVLQILKNKAKERANSDLAVPRCALSNIDLSSLSLSGIGYNLSLNNLGHEYDAMIGAGLKVAAAAGAVYVIGAAVAAEGAVSVATTADVADTVTDVMSINSNNKTVNRIEKATGYIERTEKQMTNVNTYNQNIGQQVGCSKGLVESAVGFVTDGLMGKPQRKRAISNYLDSVLMPDLKQQIKQLTEQVGQNIKDVLMQEAEITISEKQARLIELQVQFKKNKTDFERRVKQLKEYRNDLNFN